MQGKNQEKPIKSSRRLASSLKYISPNQLTFDGFETPFEQKLTKDNRWVKLSYLIPWDQIVGLYDKQFTSKEGRPPICGRFVIGAVIIKHMLNLSDRETISQIRENMFMQYFLGYSSFTNEPPFDASLFVDIRERLSLAVLNSISELVIAHHIDKVQPNQDIKDKDDSNLNSKIQSDEVITHQGSLLMDATVAPQNITFPTDLKVLNATREKSEEIIDKLYVKSLHGEVKPRTYRKLARKDFLNTNKKKRKTYKEIRQANSKQLQYLNRNIKHIDKLLEVYYNDIEQTKLSKKLKEYYHVIKMVYEQQNYMYQNNVNTIENRIVNIHQPHVRPIVRGKEGVKVEFGSKIHISMINGFASIDKLNWNAFNESTCLKDSVESYFKKYNFYPKNVLVDTIYCTRENRNYLKALGIGISGKNLGRPKKEAVQIHISPGERNPVEGKFGQAKVGYGMDNIYAKLKTTSESWVGSIMLVLNLVKLTRLIPLWIKIILESLEICLIELCYKKKKYGFSLTADPN